MNRHSSKRRCLGLRRSAGRWIASIVVTFVGIACSGDASESGSLGSDVPRADSTAAVSTSTSSVTSTSSLAPEDSIRLFTAAGANRLMDPYGALGTTAFWWGRGHPEIAQSVVVEEPFLLTKITFWIQRASALPNWRDAPEEAIAYQHEVRWSGTVSAARVRLTIWKLDARPDLDLDVAELSPLSQQTITVDMPIAGFTSNEDTELVLSDALNLESGYYLLSLGLEAVGDPDIFNLYIYGRNYGRTDRLGFNQDKEVSTCPYDEAPDRYPAGRAYFRVFGTTGAPVDLSGATNMFSEYRGKVMAESLNDCPTRENFFLPGDLDLTLWGRVATGQATPA